MGKLTEINEDNIEEFKDFISEDIAENIGREYYYGLASMDGDEPGAAIVWNIINADSSEDVESEIVYFSASQSEDGQELINEYIDRASYDNVSKSFFELENVEDDEKSVITEAGFDAEQAEGRNLFSSLDEILAKGFGSKKKSPSYVVPLETLSLLQFRQGVTNCMFCGRVGLNEDLAMLPFEWYEKDVSCCTLADGKVSGIFLVHRKPSGTLVPVLLYASGVDARKEMLHMLRFSVNAAAEKYPANTGVIICRHDDKTKALAAYLFPEKKGKEVFKGERKEEGFQ